MLRSKRLLFPSALAAVLLVGSPVEGRAQGRRVFVAARPVIVARPYFYASPFWYDPWFYDAQWGIYPPYRYGGYRIDPGASMRLEVKPKEAEVYVDGYYAGIVDDFDGMFQRLRTTPGQHELVLYLDGYRTVHQQVYLTPDNTFKVKYTMERLAPGEAPLPKPQPVPTPQAGEPGVGAPAQPPMYPPPPRGPAGRRPPPMPRPPDQPAPGDPRGGPPQNAYGTLSVRVQPGDADILVDGEKWRGPQGQERLVIDVAEGRHTVEIQKSGFRTYITEVQVRRGETTPLNVSLRSQEQ